LLGGRLGDYISRNLATSVVSYADLLAAFSKLLRGSGSLGSKLEA
jgi:hypothetical protein